MLPKPATVIFSSPHRLQPFDKLSFHRLCQTLGQPLGRLPKIGVVSLLTISRIVRCRGGWRYPFPFASCWSLSTHLFADSKSFSCTLQPMQAKHCRKFFASTLDLAPTAHGRMVVCCSTARRSNSRSIESGSVALSTAAGSTNLVVWIVACPGLCTFLTWNFHLCWATFISILKRLPPSYCFLCTYFLKAVTAIDDASLEWCHQMES